MRGLVALLVVLPVATVVAEPEGYRGGTGRSPGTTYVPPGGGLSVRVQRVSVERPDPRAVWWCGGVRGRAGTAELVTIVLDVSNPAPDAITTSLPLLDLVLDEDPVRVVEGSCVRDPKASTELILGAAKHARVRVHFLVPRGAAPKILVYNDDDFPALFALPKARRARRR